MEIAPLFEQLVKNERLSFSATDLQLFCKKWQIADMWLFGSILRKDFNPDCSDLDVLVRFSQKAPWDLFDLVTIEQALTELSGRKVDLFERKGVENGRNPFRKAEILGTAQKLCSTVSVTAYESA